MRYVSGKEWWGTIEHLERDKIRCKNVARIRRQNDREYQKNYYLKNRLKIIQYSKEWRKNNPTKVREQWVKYRKENFELLKIKYKKYSSSNPHKICEKASKKRALLANACVMVSKEQRKILFCIYKTSKRISNCTRIPHHVDHVIPLSRGGKHVHTNLQILPAKLNLLKSNKLP